jgi:2-polyprenyl-3-methyl-5-hydroxy-6-metoxy-1,4-benzoquinol methylase
MKSRATGAQKYFDSVPEKWDALYSHENWYKYLFNKWLRKGLYERYRLTFKQCIDLGGKTVLDIGCGTGRYSIECAKRGAELVVGIDFAPSMIEYSQKIALQMGVADRCKFICDDFLKHTFNNSFDIVLAMGFFDYIKDPEPIFKKIAEMKPRKFMASFPRYTPFWDIQRKIRYYWFKKCSIYNYTAEQLENLSRQAMFPSHQIIPCRRGYFLVTAAK